MAKRGMTGLPTGAWADVARRVRRVAMIALPAAGLALALVGVAPAGHVLAEHNQGSSIDLGGSIAGSVSDAVSGIATNSSSNVSGGVQVSHSEQALGSQEGLAVSDASGGDHNIGAKSGSGG